MDLINNLAIGFTTALSLHNLLYCFIGVTLGTLIGVLPGLGPGRDSRDAATDHLLSRSDFRADYARGHLLRFSVRRFHNSYSRQPPGRICFCRDLS